MTRVAVTGANGFLGWHTKLALREQNAEVEAIPVGDRFDLRKAISALDGSARAIHIAGVNRAEESDVREGNLRFAEQFAQALRMTTAPPPVVVYANSTQSSNGSVYGEAKLRGGKIVAEAAATVGAEFVDVMLPNLFGEHGRPFYNAVTATFCHLLAEGGSPTVDNDKELTLLHAQNAADLLTGSVDVHDARSLEVRETVSGLLGRLKQISETYATGEIPNLGTTFDRDLFNTYRSHAFESVSPFSLTQHSDQRGSFFEIVRSHGGTGQSAFSTTAPGVTRGDHFHRRKVERFTVLSGDAVISVRRAFTDRTFRFAVSGEAPVAVDMPTGWSHNITNTGNEILYTSFWTNEIFDSQNPDTIAEVV